MRRAYLPLIFTLFTIVQSCRPSTNNETGFSSPSGDTTQQSATPNQDTTSSSGDPDALLMHGEVGSSGDFMVSATEAGLTEVKLAELALERSNSAKVKEFAQMMLKDHNSANTELNALAGKKSVNLPSALCLECRAKYDALSRQDGREFDSTYMMMMIKDHRAILERFVFQSDKGGDSLVKKWAADKIPTLQHHLSTAEKWKGSY